MGDDQHGNKSGRRGHEVVLNRNATDERRKGLKSKDGWRISRELMGVGMENTRPAHALISVDSE